MGLRVSLDTNAYVALKGGDSRVAGYVRRAEQIWFSAVVIGELLYGFRHGERFQRNWSELESFLESPHVSVAPVTLATADWFGRFAADLRRKGTPLPTNDIWIAAHASELGAELLSFDRHFEALSKLRWTHLA